MYFYYLLLSGNYTSDTLSSDLTVEQLVKRQFPETLAQSNLVWKRSEVWPANIVDAITNKPKLFLICNPLLDGAFTARHLDIAAGTHVVLLYTDMKTQVRMSLAKRANWFLSVDYSSISELKRLYRKLMQSSVYWNGMEVDPMIPAIVEKFAATAINLRDVLVQPCAEAQREFVEYWKSLHSAKIRRSLCQ